MRRIVMGLLLSLTIPSLAAALPGEARARLVSADRALRELRVEEAAAALDVLVREHPRDAEVQSTVAMLRLHQGAYSEAVAAMESSLVLHRPRDGDSRLELLELMRSTRDATANYVETRSEDGRFVVRHAPGRDATLVPYALEALRRIDRALEEELGGHVPGPVRLELYPNAATLAAVSALTVENIETSGTIALCKWDRLMVTSPRALIRGYPWMDTIAHEYVHLVLTRLSRDHAPVWFQEGVAKFLERRWRESEANAYLAPQVQGLLDDAVREDRLLPFDRLHPSIALLPSQADAALAFAQVSSFVARFHAAYGKETLQRAIADIASGTDARDALAASAGTTWARLEGAWRESLSPQRDASTPDFRALRFRQGGEDPEGALAAEGDAEEVAAAARRHLRLGDLLWGRRRYGAAAEEYGRSLAAAPGDPLLASRLARAALAAGDGARAAEALRPIAEAHPEHAPTRAVLGSALRVLGDLPGAREHAEAAIALNPFDPRPHCDIAAITTEAREQRRESRACDTLGGEAP